VSRSSSRRLRAGSDVGPGLGENGAKGLTDEIEVLLLADQGRGQLNDRIAPVVGAADQPGVEKGAGQEAAQKALRLVVVEGLPGVLVLDQLDAVEEALALTSPTIGRSLRPSSTARKSAARVATLPTRSSFSMRSRLAKATAVDTG